MWHLFISFPICHPDSISLCMLVQGAGQATLRRDMSPEGDGPREAPGIEETREAAGIFSATRGEDTNRERATGQTGQLHGGRGASTWGKGNAVVAGGRSPDTRSCSPQALALATGTHHSHSTQEHGAQGLRRVCRACMGAGGDVQETGHAAHEGQGSVPRPHCVRRQRRHCPQATPPGASADPYHKPTFFLPKKEGLGPAGCFPSLSSSVAPWGPDSLPGQCAPKAPSKVTGDREANGAW